ARGPGHHGGPASRDRRGRGRPPGLSRGPLQPLAASPMSLSLRLDVRQSQSLVMTPQLQQAIKLLQLGNLELAAYVQGELEQNPFLERQDESAEPAPEPPAAEPAREGALDGAPDALDGAPDMTPYQGAAEACSTAP